VGTVTSRHHTGHRGVPATVTSHNGRYLVGIDRNIAGLKQLIGFGCNENHLIINQLHRKLFSVYFVFVGEKFISWNQLDASSFSELGIVFLFDF